MTLGLLLTALFISLWHAMMPTHWLPFVLVGKAHHWSRLKLLLTTLLAGACHATTMLALGLVAWFVGKGIVAIFSSVAKYVVASVLLLVGAVYIASALLSPPHGSGEFINKFGHMRCGECHPNSGGEKIEWFAVLALMLMLTLSPCQAILPLFFAAAASGFESLTALMLLTGTVTMLVMASMVMLASCGLKLLKLQVSERIERMLIGLVSIALILFVFHH
ncbi:MAG: hypothetical protein GDYSWBUE_001663 [Candidatus Fervidibacterota bacterium]